MRLPIRAQNVGHVVVTTIRSKGQEGEFANGDDRAPAARRNEV